MKGIVGEKRLKSLFTKAALGLGVVFAGCVNQKSVTDNMRGDEPADNNKAKWEQLLTEYARPYYYDRSDTIQMPARPGGTIAVQVESSINDSRGMLLHPQISPLTILSRHGESAASILDRTADGMAGKDVEVHFVEKASSLNKWFWDASSPEARALFHKADVVSLSMGIPARGDQRFVYSDGDIDTRQEIAKADALWRASNTILVKSAGNSGRDKEVDLERAHATLMMRADALLKVGEAGIDRSGPYIEEHSSRSSPAFVTSNPYFHGFSYPYVRDVELPDLIKEIYNNPVEGYGRRTGAEIFASKLMERAMYGPRARVGDPKDCHPEFNKAKFLGKDALQQSAAWQAQNPEEVRKAFANGVINAAKYMEKSLGADKNGFISELYGTSFSGPHAAGMLAAAHAKYPQLNEYDLMAAAVIASEPVDRVKRTRSSFLGRITYYETVAYEDNGAGLPYNDRIGGFGYLDPDLFERTVAEMAEMVNDNRRLGSKIERIDREVQFSGTTIAGKTGAVYAFSIDEDMIAVQTNLAIKFLGGPSSIPDKITLVNPAGGEIEISPTRSRGSMEFSLAETIGHAGNRTKGTWQIKVPDGVGLESVRLTIAGVDKGSVVGAFMAKHGSDTPARDSNQDPVSTPWLLYSKGNKAPNPRLAH